MKRTTTECGQDQMSLRRQGVGLLEQKLWVFVARAGQMCVRGSGSRYIIIAAGKLPAQPPHPPEIGQVRLVGWSQNNTTPVAPLIEEERVVENNILIWE